MILINRFKLLLDRCSVLKKILIFFYTYSLGLYLNSRRSKRLMKNGKLVLQKIDFAFKSYGMSYWLDFGTLLGAVREKNFIKEDIDIDIGMWLDDYSSDFSLFLESLGFFKIRRIELRNEEGVFGLEETYRILDIDIDIFFYTKVNSKLACYHDFIPMENSSRIGTIQKLGGLIAREITLPICEIGHLEFQGKEYPVPYPVEDHLIGRYGVDYLIKDTKWNIKKGAKDNVKILDKVGLVDYIV